MKTFRVGTSGWTYTSWKKNFYPVDCPQSKWLEYYSQHFDTVELNATFYRFFGESTYDNWYQRVPKDFKYVVKVPGYITHRKLLIDAESQLKSFCSNAKLLKRKLGLFLLQLSPKTPYDLARLEQKLIALGKDVKKVVVEFRHDKWLTDEAVNLLKKYQAIFCNVDSPTNRLQTIVTAKTSYIRLHGRRSMYDYFYSKKELKEIANQAQELQKKGAQTIYIFFNNDVNANSVKNALTLRDILEQQ